jgi:hypothetical protein
MEAAEVIFDDEPKPNGQALTTQRSAPLPVTSEASVFSAIERIMTDPNASVERANQAFEFYQKVQADQARKAFDAAMADAKAEMPPILKNRVVDFTSQKGRTNYKHEDLGEIARTIDPILGKHGLSYRFRTTSVPNEPILVTCIVSHRLGYSEENSLQAGRDESGNKNSIQAIGSTITYLQRYTLKAALGLAASNDDDAKNADQAATDVVTDDQAQELRDLINKTGTDLDRFLEVAKAESVPDVLAKDFPRLKQLLSAKLNGAKK